MDFVEVLDGGSRMALLNMGNEGRAGRTSGLAMVSLARSHLIDSNGVCLSWISTIRHKAISNSFLIATSGITCQTICFDPYFINILST